MAATVSLVENELLSLRRVVELCGVQTEDEAVRRHDPDPAAAPPDWPSEGAIELRQLTVAYGWGRDPALQGASLRIPGGSSCALVGRSGSGKSTAVLALAGCVPVLSGELLVDGVALARLPTQRVRDALAVVLQQPCLFKGAPRREGRAAGPDGAARVPGMAVQRRVGPRPALRLSPQPLLPPVPAARHAALQPGPLVRAQRRGAVGGHQGDLAPPGG